ncbi:hypothetical protein [Halostella litorea]|uniref:hypothetical protein n=1 Tax=Halostella litorea TaxID=2528831 RepID=UPI001092B4AE|nr:hypothetical protein [Halostella litorea]
MRRRRLLRALPAAAVAATAGCGAAGGFGGDDPTSGSTERTATDEPADEPDPGAFPPGEADDVTRVVWYGNAGDDRMSLEPSSSEGSLPAEFSFALENTSETTFNSNFHSWLLAKQVGDRWYRVAPRYVPQPLMTLPPGERHRWHLSVDGEHPNPIRAFSGGTEEVSVSGLGGGIYAFAIDGWFEDRNHEDKTAFAARIELGGDEIRPVPSAAVEGTSRDGSVVTVRAEGYNEDSEDARPATYVLRRVDGAFADARRLIPEQVVRRWPLNDALAHVGPDVDEVRIEAKTATHPPFGVQEDAPPIRYRGGTFAVSATER